MKGNHDHKVEFEIDIIDLSEQGQGIGKRQGFIWFVEGAIPGDRVLCHAIKVNKNWGKARVVKWIKLSEKGVNPPCSYFPQCGGCQIQNYDYIEQLHFKRNSVLSVLERIGHFKSPEVKMTIGMEYPYRYRNKGAYAIGEKDGKPLVGLYEAKSHDIVNIEDCFIQHEGHAPLLKVIRNYMADYGVRAYDEKINKGILRHLVIRQSDDNEEMMVTLVTHKKKLPMSDKLVEMILDEQPLVVSIYQNIQPQKTQEILGDESILLWGKETITDKIGDLSFQISPVSFFQVNGIQSTRLYEVALEAAELEGHETVFDLYSGTGTLSLFLAQKAKKVYGVELNARAVQDAMENSTSNGFENVEFHVGRSEIVAPHLYSEGVRADVVVLDPPRTGCDEKVLECIVDMAPKKVVYVSCKPSTMARDARYLAEKGGYEIKWVQPVDMFGQTTSIECVMLMSRNEK